MDVIPAVLAGMAAHTTNATTSVSCCRLLCALAAVDRYCDRIVAEGGIAHISSAMVAHDEYCRFPCLHTLFKIAGDAAHRSAIIVACSENIIWCISNTPADSVHFHVICGLAKLLADTNRNRQALIEAGVKQAFEAVLPFWFWQPPTKIVRDVLAVLDG
jgi:hypothetical protein